MWPVLIGAVVGGVFTLLGGVVGQVRQDKRSRLGAAQLLKDEMFLNAWAIEKYLGIYAETDDEEELPRRPRRWWLIAPRRSGGSMMQTSCSSLMKTSAV